MDGNFIKKIGKIMVEISVIVPVYNVEKYIEKCLNSILNQSFLKFELICVNDGSTDNSLEIMKKKISESEKNINYKIINTINLGLSNARNIGLKNASGKYIVFIDSDDWVEYNMLEELYNNAIQNNSDIVCCGFSRVSENDKKITVEQTNLPMVMDSKKAIITCAPASWNKMYKKSLFIDNNIYFPSGLWYEDLSTTTRLFMKSKKITVVNKSLVNYLQRSNSIIHTYNEKVNDIYKVLIDLEMFDREYCNNTYKSEIEYLFIIHIIFAHLFRCSHLKREELKKEIEFAYNILFQYFDNWSKNIYLRHKKGLFGLLMKFGSYLFKIKQYVFFLYLYRLYNFLIPVKKKW